MSLLNTINGNVLSKDKTTVPNLGVPAAAGGTVVVTPSKDSPAQAVLDGVNAVGKGVSSIVPDWAAFNRIGAVLSNGPLMGVVLKRSLLITGGMATVTLGFVLLAASSKTVQGAVKHVAKAGAAVATDGASAVVTGV